MEKKEAGMNSVKVDWNWRFWVSLRYWYEFEVCVRETQM